MNELASNLERIGLSQYLDSFIEEGFDTWETVLYITESDLDALNVRLGHRRRLQREIATARNITFESLIPQIGTPGSSEPLHSVEGASGSSTGTFPEKSTTPSSATKRKYRRHPKPDENAPERPPSAYVIFSNAIREEVKDRKLSFTEIAKAVGERWQNLPHEEKKRFESEAASAKEEYNAKLSRYKRTAEYREYQKYLSDFKAKNSASASDNKRPKMEKAPSSGSTGSMSSGPPSAATGHSNSSLVGSIGQNRRRADSLGGYKRSPAESVHGSPTPGIPKPIHPPPLEASSPSSTSTTPVTSTGHRLSVSSQSTSGQPSRLQSLPRIVPLEPGREPVPPPPPASLPALITEPSRVSYSYRRTTNAPHAPLLHHDTSKSSMSSNISNTSTNSSAFTPITPLEEARSSPAQQHGSAVTYQPGQTSQQPWLVRPQSAKLESSTGSHGSDSASPFNRLSISEQLPDDDTSHNYSRADYRYPTEIQRETNHPSTLMRSEVRPDETDPGRGGIDALSVLALAGHMVDREASRPKTPP